jgi:preprotein translocase subunit SecG
VQDRLIHRGTGMGVSQMTRAGANQATALVGLATGYAEVGADVTGFVGWVFLLLAGILAPLALKLRPQAG